MKFVKSMRLFAVALVLFVAVLAVAAPAHADQAVPLTPGDTGPIVQQVQLVLRSHGYVIPVDGVYGPRTLRAVIKWQRANGLDDDGIIGPITLGSLLPAERLDPPANNGGQAANIGGLRGMPFAPSGLDGCAEMAWYAQQAGLPDTVPVADGTGGFDDRPTRDEAGFDEQAIGRRESACNNGSANSIAGGYWGIAWSNLSASGYRLFTGPHCQAFAKDDIVGNSELARQKQSCVAKVLFDWWASHPGQPWPWRL